MDIGRLILEGLEANGVEHAVVEVSEGKTKHVKVMDNRIDSLVSSSFSMASIFAARKGRVMFTNIEDLTAASATESVKSVAHGLSLITPKDYYYGIADGPFKYGRRPLNDRRISLEEYSVEGIVSETVEAALGAGAAKVHGMLSLGYQTQRTLTSGGVDAEETGTSVSNSMRAFAPSGLSAHSVSVSRTLSGIDNAQVGRSAGEMATRAKARRRVEPGKYDIIFAPLAAGNLMSLVGESASISSVEAGFSFLAKKLGNEVANRGLSIYDDATIPGGIGSRRFDAEGVPSMRTRIIGGGTLKSYLHNTSTAKKYGARTTANAGLTDPEPTNIVIDHRKSYRELGRLLGAVDRGILVTNTWYTRFSNYLTGDFSTVPRDVAFLVERGEVKYAISMGAAGSASVGIRINDNFIRLMHSIEACGGPVFQANAWDSSDVVFTPALLVRDVIVTTASFI